MLVEFATIDISVFRQVPSFLPPWMASLCSTPFLFVTLQARVGHGSVLVDTLLYVQVLQVSPSLFRLNLLLKVRLIGGSTIEVLIGRLWLFFSNFYSPFLSLQYSCHWRPGVLEQDSLGEPGLCSGLCFLRHSRLMVCCL